MLTAGTFFPLKGLGDVVEVLGWFNPLHHCVELVRHAAFGLELGTDLAHVAALVVFGLLTWRLAVVAVTRKLIT
jgi:lipooligosaccharide transport system permease protein